MINYAAIKADSDAAQADSGSGRSKLPRILAGIVCAAVLCALIFALRNAVAVSLAIRDIKSNDFEAAYTRVAGIGTGEADTVRKYTSLRIDINRRFPLLLESYDADIIEAWVEQINDIIVNGTGLDKTVMQSVVSMRASLIEIRGAMSEYRSLSGDVENLMLIFNEYNRLHTVTDGQSVAFTVAEEFARADSWQANFNAVSEFADRRFGTGGVYLLSYMLKEAQNELGQLRSAMQTIADNGYDIYAKVSYNDNLQRTFPDIPVGADTNANLLDSAAYIEYMHGDICRSLISGLAVYYTAKG